MDTLITLLALLSIHKHAEAFSASVPTRHRGVDALHMSSNYGDDMDQEAMMESDMLIVVDENDRIVRDVVVSKRKAHEFSWDSPRGIAHRAFSFFIFNNENKMLLTRRALSKITFPGVWTNTCCSHPLHNMIPNEVDDDDAFPNFPGIKHAAVRKLKHELGIEPEYLPRSEMRFVSRFHYWAADTHTYGSTAPWGEHEIDYVLFLKCDAEPPVVANDDEVSEYKYVSISELKEMLEDPSLEWSPWFQGIMKGGGFFWWEEMEETLKGAHTNEEVQFFDPPSDHYAEYNLESHTRLTGVLKDHSAASVDEK